MWQDIYLEVDKDGYIKNPDKGLIKGNIRLKLKNDYKNIKIGNNFLFGCSGLKKLDLSSLQNVTYIRSHFLFGCSGLKELDLSGLQNITTIGVFFDGNEYFLDGCKGLELIRCKGKIKELIDEKYPLLEELIEKEVIDNKIYINDSIKIEI